MMTAFAVISLTTTLATAQERGFLDRIFGDSERVNPSAPQAQPTPQSGPTTGQSFPGRGVTPGAPASESDLMIRIERLEARLRELTGAIEQLQFRNQQLEGRLGGGGPPAQPPVTPAHPPATPAQPSATPALPPATGAPTGGPTRRGDAFDPSQHPGAPGAPHVLGSMQTGSVPGDPAQGEDDGYGAPGGRAAGAPLDLSTLAAPGARQVPQPGTAGGQPPVRAQGGNPQVATLPPSDSPRDHFDLAYGYVLRKDYALAESGFREFLQRYPGDRLAPDAHYWLGESLFQRQQFRDAAESFLNVSTKYETAGRAPEALLRLGQSLGALGEKEAACASFAEVLRKYPRASVGVRQGVDREQKRIRC